MDVLTAPSIEDDLFIIDEKKEAEEEDSSLAVVDCDKALIAKFLDAKKRKGDAEADEKLYGADLKRIGEPLRIAEAGRQHALVKSVLLAGQLRYTCMCKYTALKPKMADVLLKQFGDSYAAYIATKHDVELDPKAMAAGKNDAEARAAFQMLQRKGWLVASRKLAPTELLYRDYSFDEKVRNICISLNILPQQMLVLPKSVSARNA